MSKIKWDGAEKTTINNFYKIEKKIILKMLLKVQIDIDICNLV